MSALVGIDVGGTFTDLFHVEDGGALKVVKVPSTPHDPSVGVLDALTASGLKGEAVGALLHGTTIATNALIERRGARCALITTRGFRDVLELGRRDRPRIYGLTGTHNPLIARDQRWEVDERLDHKGRVVTPLDEAGLGELAEALAGEELDADVVSFLHAYANPVHEERARDILLAANADWHVVTSHTVLREYYEFERTSTAVVQGYLQPLVSRYADQLVKKLSGWGFTSDALIMQSNGGAVPAARMGERAAHMLRSGPAAGVIAAARLAGEAGFDKIVTADMGGTSFDVGISLDGRPQETESVLLDFRLPVRVPMVDVRTIGAGGGSIASVDRGGILQVGSRSAGSVPGPVSFGRGGTEPTVTDANVVLGRIDADRPIGAGGGRLDVEGARAAIARIGEALGLAVEEAAQAILAVVNTRMAGETRLVTLEQGHDPREFALVAFGGAGPCTGPGCCPRSASTRCWCPASPACCARWDARSPTCATTSARRSSACCPRRAARARTTSTSTSCTRCWPRSASRRRPSSRAIASRSRTPRSTTTSTWPTRARCTGCGSRSSSAGRRPGCGRCSWRSCSRCSPPPGTGWTSAAPARAAGTPTPPRCIRKGS